MNINSGMDIRAERTRRGIALPAMAKLVGLRPHELRAIEHANIRIHPEDVSRYENALRQFDINKAATA